MVSIKLMVKNQLTFLAAGYETSASGLAWVSPGYVY